MLFMIYIYKDKYHEVTVSHPLKTPSLENVSILSFTFPIFVLWVTKEKPRKVNTPASAPRSHRQPSSLPVLCWARQSRVASQPIHFPSSLGGSDHTVLHVQSKNHQHQILLPTPTQILHNSVLATFSREKRFKKLNPTAKSTLKHHSSPGSLPAWQPTLLLMW